MAKKVIRIILYNIAQHGVQFWNYLQIKSLDEKLRLEICPPIKQETGIDNNLGSTYYNDFSFKCFFNKITHEKISIF